MATSAPESSRTSPSSPADDKKFSMHWLIGGGIVGALALVAIIYHVCFSSKAKAGMECPGGEHGAGQHDACMDDLVCIEAKEDVPEIKAQNGTDASPALVKGKFYCKAMEKPGWSCPTENTDECTEDAVCVQEDLDVPEKLGLPARVKDRFYCKAFPGGKCVSDECVHGNECDSNICQYLPEAGSCHGESGLEVVGKYCKAKEGASCNSPRHTPMQWCMEGLSCQRDGGGAPTCKKAVVEPAPKKQEANAEDVPPLAAVAAAAEETPTPTGGGASIQLGETMETGHAANRSRVTKSISLPKKRTQTFLQPDFD